MGDRHVAMGLLMLAPLRQRLIANFLAQLDHSIKDRFGARRTAGQIKIHRNQLVDAAHCGGGVSAEHATGDGASAHGDHVLRLRHLLIKPHQGWRHLHGDGAGHDQKVGLARGTAGNQTETVEIETGTQQRREFNEAAGRSVKKRPEAAQTGPVVQVIQAGEDDVLAEVVGCLLYTSPSPRDLSTSRMPSSA